MEKALLYKLAFKDRAKGFTLVELMIVLIIIGLLMTLAVPSLIGSINRAKRTVALSNMRTWAQAQELYYGGSGIFARSLEDLEINTSKFRNNDEYNYVFGPASPTRTTFNGNAVAGGIYPVGATVFTTVNNNGTIQTNSVICWGNPNTQSIDMSNVNTDADCPVQQLTN